MPWHNQRYFTTQWLKRCDRTNQDDGDRFINLWIAFNGWMRGTFGETLSDRALINQTKAYQPLQQQFDILKQTSEFRDLRGEGDIFDMRGTRSASYDGSFESFIEVLYMIRCNLFHGRKDVTDNERDIKLVGLAYRTLRPLLEGIISGQI